MSLIQEDISQERQILKHNPWPGYKRAFYIVFTIAVLYLFFIFYLGYRPH